MPPPGDDLHCSVIVGEGTVAFHERGGIALKRSGTLIGAIGVCGEASKEQELACATVGAASYM